MKFGRVIGTVVAIAVAVHAILHGQEASGAVSWWLGAALASTLVVGVSYAVLRRAHVVWTLVAAALLHGLRSRYGVIVQNTAVVLKLGLLAGFLLLAATAAPAPEPQTMMPRSTRSAATAVATAAAKSGCFPETRRRPSSTNASSRASSRAFSASSRAACSWRRSRAAASILINSQRGF